MSDFELDADGLNRRNAGRKADREALAETFTILARLAGATLVRRRDEARMPGIRDASIHLEFELEGVGAIMSFSNLHGGDKGLISWFNTARPSRNFSPAFNAAVREYSGRPHHKATTCCADWYGLANAFANGLKVAARDQAFVVEPLNA